MIAHIYGKLTMLEKGRAVVDISGVGYLINIPSCLEYETLKTGMNVKFYTHLNVTENGMDLFGFLTVQERDIFLMLTAISSFGPKLALSIISSISVSDLAYAVSSGEKKLLKKIPGLGDKKSERLILELKGNDKLSEMLFPEKREEPAQTSFDFDYSSVLDVLEALGCSKSEAALAVKKAASLYENKNSDELLGNTMKILEGSM